MKKIFFALIIMWKVNLFGQSPWVNSKGSLYTQLSYTYLKYNSVFDFGGQIVPISDLLSDYTISSYTEYSITEGTSLQLMVPFKMVGFQGFSKARLGDVELGGKTSFSKLGLPVTAYYIGTMPSSTNGGDFYMNDVSEILNTGYDRWSLEGAVSSGFALDKY